MSKQIDLVGVGLNATDTLIALEHFPERGSKQEFTRLSTLPGGQVASAVTACRTWGLSTRYVGKLGDDDAADRHEQEFRRLGVDTRLIRVPGHPSPQSFVLIDASGERTILGRRDEHVFLQPEDLRQEWITDARVLLVDGHDTAAATLACRWARAAGVQVVADLDEIYPGVEELVSLCDYLIVSRDFPCRFTGDSTLEGALCTLRQRFRCTLAAATLGENGVLAWDGVALHHAPAYDVPVIDTTGAGDTFHAAFIYALLEGWDLPRQLRFACAAAALNCTALGARGGIRPVSEIEALIESGGKLPSAWDTPTAHPGPSAGHPALQPGLLHQR